MFFNTTLIDHISCSTNTIELKQVSKRLQLSALFISQIKLGRRSICCNMIFQLANLVKIFIKLCSDMYVLLVNFFVGNAIIDQP